jgi:hypothetical protein
VPNCRRLGMLAAASAVVLIADDPAWRSKAIPEWTEDDARQILTDSPWSKLVAATVLPVPTEEQRRESGYMGERHGIGYDGVDERLPRTVKQTLELILTGKDPRQLPVVSLNLNLRWETALPVRAAERKSAAASAEPPLCAGEGYCIAVYGVPDAPFKGNPKKLGDPFKKDAVLRRQGRKDVKPSSVEVTVQEGGLVLVYRFPPTAEITRSDRFVEFRAQIGRLVFAQWFELDRMLFQGKLEL